MNLAPDISTEYSGPHPYKSLQNVGPPLIDHDLNLVEGQVGWSLLDMDIDMY